MLQIVAGDACLKVKKTACSAVQHVAQLVLFLRQAAKPLDGLFRTFSIDDINAIPLSHAPTLHLADNLSYVSNATCLPQHLTHICTARSKNFILYRNFNFEIKL